MPEQLRLVIARLGKALGQGIGHLREMLSQVAARREQNQEGTRQIVARRHFWAEMREGEREARARCPKEDQ